VNFRKEERVDHPLLGLGRGDPSPRLPPSRALCERLWQAHAVSLCLRSRSQMGEPSRPHAPRGEGSTPNPFVGCFLAAVARPWVRKRGSTLRTGLRSRAPSPRHQALPSGGVRQLGSRVPGRPCAADRYLCCCQARVVLYEHRFDLSTVLWQQCHSSFRLDTLRAARARCWRARSHIRRARASPRPHNAGCAHVRMPSCTKAPARQVVAAPIQQQSASACDTS